MANQPDEARPGDKDGGGLDSKPENSSQKEKPVAPTGDAPAQPKPEPHSPSEGEVLANPVESHSHDEHHHDGHHDDYHHDEYHQDEYHRHEHDQTHHDDYGGGTPVPAATSSYGGGSGGDGGRGEGGEPPRDQSGTDAQEEEGGPVKSFLDHLEDLRWMLVRCSVAIGIGMLICLISGGFIMNEVLLRPLKKAQMIGLGDHKIVALMMGTNVWGKFRVSTNDFSPVPLGKGDISAIQVVTVTIGTNTLLGLAPSTNPPPELMPTIFNPGPVGGFSVAFQIAIYGGIVLACPLVLYYIALFILPALKVKEKKYVVRGAAIGTALFLSGVSFCYFVLMPVALNASARYSEWLGISGDLWTAELYLSFVCKFMLGMGLGFEMPVVILCLVKIGIVNYQQLAAFRKYMIVINLILGAVLTTPEVLTQVLMAVPLQILYEISVWIAWYWDRQEKKRQQNAEK